MRAFWLALGYLPAVRSGLTELTPRKALSARPGMHHLSKDFLRRTCLLVSLKFQKELKT